MVATREGASRTYVTPFTRGRFGGLKLSDTHELEDFAKFYFQPILDVWRRQGTVRLPNGKAILRVWEPDALDICFCGGPKRFAECCRQYIPLIPSPEGVEAEVAKAMAAREFGRAEQLSRAALAQYVIWVKQHTVPLMNVANDLYAKFVDMDVPSLQGRIIQLQRSLEANGNAGSFVLQLRYLASIIGVPKLSVRLLTIVSHCLAESGKNEEAILEIDGLGDLDIVEDALALITAVHLLDLSAERRVQLLLRACAFAGCEAEKWEAQLALVENMLQTQAREKALPIVDSIIAESGRSETDASTLIAGLILRWRLTQAESDFRAARIAIQHHHDVGAVHYFATILIDEGMYSEAEEVAASRVEAGDPVAKLLITDARVRSGNADSARDLFHSIDREHISRETQFRYAVASALVALACKDEKIRLLAVECLSTLPASEAQMNERVQSLLRALQGERFADAVSPG
jgi:hypothetical protein